MSAALFQLHAFCRALWIICSLAVLTSKSVCSVELSVSACISCLGTNDTGTNDMVTNDMGTNYMGTAIGSQAIGSQAIGSQANGGACMFAVAYAHV